VNRPTPLPEPLQHILSALNASPDLTPGGVRRLVLEAGVEPRHLEAWQDLEHPADDSYGRRLVHQGPNFEVMVMSWRPGAFSAIHDHGHTEWGAVQVFGPAEHAVFRIDEADRLRTVTRKHLAPGDALAVTHRLVHQMGNPTDRPFLTLHVYGLDGEADVVTGDARLFDVEHAKVQHTDGGVFYALPPSLIHRVEPGPRGDYPTLLRHRVEAIKRRRWMRDAGNPRIADELRALVAALRSATQRAALLATLEEITDAEGSVTDSAQWTILNRELVAASRLQRELREAGDAGEEGDRFSSYAEEYDALIGRPNLDAFMRGYLARHAERFGFEGRDILSVGCGTGLVEAHLIETHGADRARLQGIDLSAAMVEVARHRIAADTGDMFELGALGRTFDLAYSGLNVLQYTTPARFEEAVASIASVVRPGGRFLGDFITPDHIRGYPNLVRSACGEVLSLRTPRLVERDGSLLQRSEITNVSFVGGRTRIEHVGAHERALPPLLRVRRAFERSFGGAVELFDAVSLEPIGEAADTCPSTRYVVVAHKA
jgi:SAM-dependent methyltransferase/predicted metal-dependent enzyme (double-stranded beta helix superfamily)